jgi:hypothetical protein
MARNENHSGEVDLVDVEEYGKRNEKPPKAKKYRIRVNKQHFTVDVPQMTGREILTLAGKTPAENYKLQQKLHGGQVKVIQASDVVDFTAPGVERFQWFPLTETEG